MFGKLIGMKGLSAPSLARIRWDGGGGGGYSASRPYNFSAIRGEGHRGLPPLVGSWADTYYKCLELKTSKIFYTAAFFLSLSFSAEPMTRNVSLKIQYLSSLG